MKLFAALFLGLALIATRAHGALEAQHVFHHENVLGTSLELKVAAASDSDAQKAEAVALAEIDRLAKIFSAYDPASEFSRWLAAPHGPVRVSAELFEVLGLFDEWRGRTGGALDASAEAVCRLWKSAAKEQHLPAIAEIEAAVAAVRRPHWRLDAAARTATRLSDTPLILHSFTKSYIASRAADAVLSGAKASGVVLNIGGDVVVRGAWSEGVDVADPRSDAENASPIARLRVQDRTVATSGGYRRGVEIDGRRYSHIIDPRTGRPVDHILSATVIAPRATDAGALATAFCVLAPEESLSLAAAMPGVECLLITKDGRRMSSPRWSELEVPRVQLAALNGAGGLLAAVPAAPAKAASVFDPALELVVNLELSRIEGQRVKRPYVAVWIEDKDKFPVRTLALWIAKPKWLPDLKSWMHGEKLRALEDGTDLSRSVSSATRTSGKYSLKWDGRDDKGQPVKPGRYTVFIEAAREHGTHQVMRQEIDFTGTPKKFDLPGNTEIASATLDYRKKIAAP